MLIQRVTETLWSFNCTGTVIFCRRLPLLQIWDKYLLKYINSPCYDVCLATVTIFEKTGQLLSYMCGRFPLHAKCY